MKQGIVFTDRSLYHYDLAVRNYPYSLWKDYAIEDLETDRESLQKIAAAIQASACDLEFKQQVGLPPAKIEEIPRLSIRRTADRLPG